MGDGDASLRYSWALSSRGVFISGIPREEKMPARWWVHARWWMWPSRGKTQHVDGSPCSVLWEGVENCESGSLDKVEEYLEPNIWCWCFVDALLIVFLSFSWRSGNFWTPSPYPSSKCEHSLLWEQVRRLLLCLPVEVWQFEESSRKRHWWNAVRFLAFLGLLLEYNPC